MTWRYSRQAAARQSELKESTNMECPEFRGATNCSRSRYRTAPVQFRQSLFAFQAPSSGRGREETPSLVTILGNSLAGEIHVAQSKHGGHVALRNFIPARFDHLKSGSIIFGNRLRVGRGGFGLLRGLDLWRGGLGFRRRWLCLLNRRLRVLNDRLRCLRRVSLGRL